MIDPNSSAVIDTSAAINLIATGCADKILSALPGRVLVVDTVPAELEYGRQRGRKEAALLNELASAHLVEVVTLDDAALGTLEQLVIGPAALTLDDGEAATIAYALHRGGIAIIDERKATRICAERFRDLRVGCTVDLLAHPEVMRTLGRESLSQAMLNALQLARMRVPPQYVEWVVEHIGTEQAALCASLPRTARATARNRFATDKTG